MLFFKIYGSGSTLHCRWWAWRSRHHTLCHDWGGPSFRRMSLLNKCAPVTVFEKQTDADPAALCTSFEAFKGLTSKTCPILIISSRYMRDKVISLLPGSKGTAGLDRSNTLTMVPAASGSQHLRIFFPCSDRPCFQRLWGSSCTLCDPTELCHTACSPPLLKQATKS